jgi:glucose 1-dehydrogenase
MAKKGVLEGQAALVTGGSSGIGAGICLAFAREGAKVGVNFHSDKDEADALVAKIERAGGEAVALKADISDEAQVAELYKRFVKRFGRVDIAVANAGIQKDASLTNMTMAQWNQVLGTNLGGVFLCAREAVRRFLEQGESPLSKARGKVICMSSVHDRIPWAGHVNYAASKGGIAMLMQSIAQEVAVHRIRVNAISPGAIKTPINKDAWSTPKARKKLLELIPYGRIGEPDDVAQAAVWLCSDAADYVTGTTLYVDGGMCLYPGFADNG